MLSAIDRRIFNAVEANTSGALASFLRSQKMNRRQRRAAARKTDVRESMAVLGSTDAVKAGDAVKEGARIKCVLITEGLGNRNNLNYYGPEAIESGPAIFEGKPCFLDHMSVTDETDLPERSVKAKCGYFKGVHVESVGGKKGLVGEIHFDLSEDGQRAYEKALTAIHYKQEFPNLESEYVGLSIAANGERETRRIQVDGEALDVNYVTKFTEAMSCDIVTTPARGGRFVALVESAAGAILTKKEPNMIVKSLKAARTALTEALKDEKLDEQTKKQLTEADKSLGVLLQEAIDAAEGSGNEGHALEEAKKKEKEECEAAAEEAKKKESQKKKDMEDDDKDAQESRRGYLTSLLKESAIPEKLWSMEKLLKLSLAEAKAEIEEKKALVESIRESSEFVPAGSGVPLVEADGGTNLNSLFSGCAQ